MSAFSSSMLSLSFPKIDSSHAVRTTPIPSLPISAHVLSDAFCPVNLSPASYDPAFGAGPDASVKAKIINLIASVRTIMRMPLIFVNSVIILYELILG
jgi:hypothetical protein